MNITKLITIWVSVEEWEESVKDWLERSSFINKSYILVYGSDYCVISLHVTSEILAEYLKESYPSNIYG